MSIVDSVDEFGNLWALDLPENSTMSLDTFEARFSGYSSLAVKIDSGEIYASFNDLEGIKKGFEHRGLDMAEFRLAPGPMRLDY